MLKQRPNNEKCESMKYERYINTKAKIMQKPSVFSFV